MSPKKKSIIPQVKKKLKKFLTDESGNITKKDALGISAAGAIIASGSEAIAGHSSGAHNNACGHANQAAVNQYASSHLNSNIVGHASGIINGPYSEGSNTPGHNNQVATGGHVSQAAINTGTHCSGHASHASHGNHENGGWC